MAECMEMLKWEKFLLPHNYVCVIITFSEAVGLVRPKNEAFLTSLDLNYSCDKIIKFRFDVDGYQHCLCKQPVHFVFSSMADPSSLPVISE